MSFKIGNMFGMKDPIPSTLSLSVVYVVIEIYSWLNFDFPLFDIHCYILA